MTLDNTIKEILKAEEKARQIIQRAEKQSDEIIQQAEIQALGSHERIEKRLRTKMTGKKKEISAIKKKNKKLWVLVERRKRKLLIRAEKNFDKAVKFVLKEVALI